MPKLKAGKREQTGDLLEGKGHIFQHIKWVQPEEDNGLPYLLYPLLQAYVAL